MNQPLHLCSGIEGVTNPAAVASNAGPPRWMSRDRDTRDWCAPFVMAPVNSQVVRDTHTHEGGADAPQPPST